MADFTTVQMLQDPGLSDAIYSFDAGCAGRDDDTMCTYKDRRQLLLFAPVPAMLKVSAKREKNLNAQARLARSLCSDPMRSSGRKQIECASARFFHYQK